MESCGRSTLLNSRVTGAPEKVRRTHAARRRRRREKYIFWRGVFAAPGPPGMKLTDDMEDLTSPLDNVGDKSHLVTDTERGTSNSESPEQSDETCSFVAGTSVILKDLSTAQYNGQVGEILSQGAGQDSSGCDQRENLRVNPTNRKVEDDARPEDSMLLLLQATDDALADESWPLWEYVGIKPVVPDNSMPSLEDDGNKTRLPFKSRKIQEQSTRLLVKLALLRLQSRKDCWRRCARFPTPFQSQDRDSRKASTQQKTQYQKMKQNSPYPIHCRQEDRFRGFMKNMGHPSNRTPVRVLRLGGAKIRFNLAAAKKIVVVLVKHRNVQLVQS